MTEHVLNVGDNAVAALRKPESLSDLAAKWPSDRFLSLKLDVTEPDEILAAFAKAKAAFGRLDVVFNNAGVSIIAESEGTPLEAARKLFEVNFWGAANVSREAVRFFREENKPPGGRLLQNSSVAGYDAPAAATYYAASYVTVLLPHNF